MADLPVQLPTSPIEGSFDQVLDHEAPTTDTFKQRYWFSPGFSTGPTSPTILYVCGESACSPGYAASMGDTARGLGASILVVEHRYYGKSLPFAKPKPEDMKYLTIHNALEDLAAIQKSVARERNLQGKFIAVGGSYPGMLAAFYRLKHPELAAGAWASSAPIEMVKSFPEYDARASRTLGATCSMLIRQAQAEVGRRFADPVAKAAVVRRMWATATDEQITKVGAAWVTGWIGSSGASGAQYGSGKTLCDSLAQHESDPLEGFLDFYDRPLFADAFDDAGAPDGGAAAEPVGGPEGLEAPAIPSFDLYPTPDDARAEEDFYVPINAWKYQVCREVGFYQVHNPDRTQSIFTDDKTDASYDKYCEDTFGITPDIAGTRKTYLDPLVAGEATNILFTNGTEDPWSTLSPVDPSSPLPGTETFVLQGGAHCSDLRNLTKSSAPAIFELHVKLNTLAKGWLGL